MVTPRPGSKKLFDQRPFLKAGYMTGRRLLCELGTLWRKKLVQRADLEEIWTKVKVMEPPIKYSRRLWTCNEMVVYRSLSCKGDHFNYNVCLLNSLLSSR